MEQNQMTLPAPSLIQNVDCLLKSYRDSFSAHLDLWRARLAKDSRAFGSSLAKSLGTILFGILFAMVGWVSLALAAVNYLSLYVSPTSALLIVGALHLALTLLFVGIYFRKPAAQAIEGASEIRLNAVIEAQNTKIESVTGDIGKGLELRASEVKSALNVKQVYRRNPLPFVAGAFVLGALISPRRH